MLSRWRDITTWDCRRAFRPTPTTSSLASEWRGIQRVTARPCSGHRTGCSMTTHYLAFTSWVMLPTDPPADSWRFLVVSPVVRRPLPHLYPPTLTVPAFSLGLSEMRIACPS